METDTPALEQLFLEARIRAFHWCDPSSFLRSDFSIQTEGEIVHLAEDSRGSLLGFISVWRLENFIHHLYIAPGHQRAGVGSQLLRSLQPWLPLPHRLKCLSKNETALSFYRKHGWTTQGRGSDALGDYLVMEYDGGAAGCERG